VNRSLSHPAEGFSGPQIDLLCYEDVYRAAGLLSSTLGYGIHMIVDMLNSNRIRNLSPDIRHASVLMALDAAGTSAGGLLKDATRRQQALTSYEAGQQKQLEQFAARKAQENSLIQAEMERVTAHYAERIQRNQDQVEREKETLRNWKMQNNTKISEFGSHRTVRKAHSRPECIRRVIRNTPVHRTGRQAPCTPEPNPRGHRWKVKYAGVRKNYS
jgi:hypothetical protein